MRGKSEEPDRPKTDFECGHCPRRFDTKDKLKRHWLSKSDEDGHSHYEWVYEPGERESQGSGKKKKKKPKNTEEERPEKKRPPSPPPQFMKVKEEIESSDEGEQEEGVLVCKRCGQRFESKTPQTNIETLKKLHEGSCKGG